MHVRRLFINGKTNKSYPNIHNLIRIGDIFAVTIDDLIRNDKNLQDQISIDKVKSFETFSDPGFYIGIALILSSSLMNYYLLFHDCRTCI